MSPAARRSLRLAGLLLAGLIGYAGHTAWLAWQATETARLPGPVDIGFSKDMAVHHDQAILMAVLAQPRAGPAVKALADGILLSQSSQIGAMRGWLQLWGETPDATPEMTWMAGAHVHSDMCLPGANGHQGHLHMPGMALPEELNALWARTGDAFDVHFLQLMIRHHQGGIDMARFTAERAHLAPVRQAAEVMVMEQVKDIAQMQRLLAHQGAPMLAFP